MLNPLLMMAVLTVVFSKLLPRVENYAVYLFCSLLGWQYFSSTVSSNLGAIRSNMKIIEQVPIPKFMFMISTAASNIVNLLISIVPLMIVMLCVGQPLHWTMILFPLALIPLIIYTLAFSILFGVLNVFFEDMKHLTQVLLRAWFYITPILHGPEMLPPKTAYWMQFNPLFYPILNFRDVFYNGVIPDVTTYLYSLAGGFVLLAISLWVYKKSDDKFIYFV